MLFEEQLLALSVVWSLGECRRHADTVLVHRIGIIRPQAVDNGPGKSKRLI